MKKQKDLLDCTIQWEFDYKSPSQIDRMDFEQKMEERERALEFARETKDSGENWRLIAYADSLGGIPQPLAPRIFVKPSARKMNRLPIDDFPTLLIQKAN